MGAWERSLSVSAWTCLPRASVRLLAPRTPLAMRALWRFARCPRRGARRGAAGVEGVEVNLIPIEGKDIVGGRWKNGEVLAQLDASDGIIFGFPAYVGSVSGQMESFLDATAERWLAQSWKDKVAGAFSVSGSPAETSSTPLCASRPWPCSRV